MFALYATTSTKHWRTADLQYDVAEILQSVPRGAADSMLLRAYSYRAIAGLAPTDGLRQYTLARRRAMSTRIRASVRVAADLVTHLHAHGDSIETVSTISFRAYVDSRNEKSKRHLRSFILHAGYITNRPVLLTLVPVQSKVEAPLIPTETHQRVVDYLLHADQVDDRLRMIGLMSAILGQIASDSMAMTVDDISVDDSQVTICITGTAIPISGRFAEIATAVRRCAIEHWETFPVQDHAWLFPSPRPGGHAMSYNVLNRLVKESPIESLLSVRNRATASLASALPAWSLIDTLGFSPSRAVLWVVRSANSRSDYGAAKSRDSGWL